MPMPDNRKLEIKYIYLTTVMIFCENVIFFFFSGFHLDIC